MEKFRFKEGDKIISIKRPGDVFDDFTCYRDESGYEWVGFIFGRHAEDYPAEDFEIHKPSHREDQLKILLDETV